MSAAISAAPDRVWRALTDPTELTGWDERLLGFIESAASYPTAGELFKWRYRLGSVQTVLYDRPQEVRPLLRLDSLLTLGSLRFNQTYTLKAEANEPQRTRLGMKLIMSNSVPVVGAVIDRFDVRQLATERIDATLRQLQKWCETHP